MRNCWNFLKPGFYEGINLAGHHLLTLYLRELSIVAHKLGPAELALTIRPGRGHRLARRVARARVAGADCGVALVWRGVAVRHGRLRLRSGLAKAQVARARADPARAVSFPGYRTGQRPHPAGWARDRAEAWGLGKAGILNWPRGALTGSNTSAISSPPGGVYGGFAATNLPSTILTSTISSDPPQEEVVSTQPSTSGETFGF